TRTPIQASFFFQAEDGIRDWSVTGVQTCALPISIYRELDGAYQSTLAFIAEEGIDCYATRCGRFIAATSPAHYEVLAKELGSMKIGRASCRERGERSEDAVAQKQKRVSGERRHR